jgi:hypothetical protein
MSFHMPTVQPNPTGGTSPASTPTTILTPLAIAGNLPVLLLPFRLETRFVQAPSPTLLVRVYPSQISINAFKQQLTTAEIQAGQAYWTATWTAMGTPGADQAGPWRSLASRYGPQRGAWIVAQTQPATVTAGEPLVFHLPAASSEQPLPALEALPDQWAVLTWDTAASSPAFSVFTNPVATPLNVTTDPLAANAADPTSSPTDPSSAWMTDFQAAVDAGMATCLPLTAPQAQNGFARVVVVGVRAPKGLLSPHPGADGALLLSGLLNAHHYCDGLAFVPQGTATKSTPTGQAGYSSQDPGYETSYETEQGASLMLPPDPNDPSVLSDGQIALGALGLGSRSAVFDHVYGADGLDRQDAIDMATSLWPVTIGYFLRQVMATQSVPQELATVEALRTHFIEHVCARGPLPALRVGDTPYGILPVTSVGAWQPGATVATNLDWLVPYFQNALPIWEQSYAQTPRVGGSSDPDADLVGILGMDASSTSYQYRYVLGPGFLNEAQGFVAPSAGAAWGQWQQAALTPIQQLWAQIGFPPVDPDSPFSNQPKGAPGFAPYALPVCGSVVQDAPVSETNPLGPDYIEELLAANHAQLHAEQAEVDQGPLLQRLLRASLLEEYAASAQDFLLKRGLADGTLIEPELIDLSGPGTQTLWTLLQTPVSALGNQTLGSYIDALRANPVMLAAQFPRVAELRQSLQRLARRPSAKLERAMSEVLDVCSHRLDAWVTALATALMPGPQSSAGLYIGGYSWVEDLHPATPTPAAALSATEQQAIAALDALRSPSAPAPGPVQPPDVDNGGFIHAPSAAQGAAAAVLRNGYLTHQQSTEGTLLAIDLSSQRVNTALWYLDGVRQGQSLGALLGYTFEQALAQAGLQTLLPGFRNAYPLVANKLNPAPGNTPASALAAPNVVDGLTLQRAWAQPQWQSPVSLTASQQDTINHTLLVIADVLDAMGDLSLSESFYQIVLGNPGRAGGLLSAVSRGERPPEVQIVETPHGGRSFTHRLLAMFSGQQPPQPAWSTGDGNPRAAAEPWLDNWLRALLPNPANVKCWVQSGSGSSAQTLEISLDQIGAGSLDLLAMAGSADKAQLSELEQRVLYQASGQLTPGAPTPQVQFSGALDRSNDITVPDLLVLLRSARDLLSAARALKPADLSTPDQPDNAPLDAADLDDRASAAASQAGKVVGELTAQCTALQSAIASPGSDDTTVRAQNLASALLAASWFGVRGAVPPGPTAAGASPSALTAAFDTAASIWTLTFTVSATGELTPGATITLLAPPGTTLPTGTAEYTVGGQAVGPSPPPRVRQSMVTLIVPAGVHVAAGAVTQVAVTVAAAPPPGSYSWAVATSADTLFAVSAPFSISGAGTSVGTITVTADNPTPGVAATYTVAFETSASGALSGAASAGPGSITLSFAPGTIPSARPGDYLINGAAPASVDVAASQVTLTLAAAARIAAQTTVTVVAAGATNQSAGTYAAAAWTSADIQANSGGYAIGPLPFLIAQAGQVAAALGGEAQMPSEVNVQSVTVTANSFTVQFTTSPTGMLAAGAGTITLLGPPAMAFSTSPADYLVTAATATGPPQPATVSLQPVTAPGSVRLTVPVAIGQASPVTLTGTLTAVPPAGSYTLSIATSSDVTASASDVFSLPGPGTTPTGVTVAVDPTGSSYTINFTTSASGGLNAQQNPTITLIAPPQTQFSTSASDYTINGTALQATPFCTPGQVVIPVPASIAASTPVTVTAANVASPGAGSYAISVATSADLLAASSASFPIPASANDSLALLESIFGRSFMVLPQFTPSALTGLEAAFADSPQLTASDPVSPDRWLQQLTHVRDAISRADLTLSLAQILAGSAAPQWAVAQLPQLPGDTWLALPQPSSLSGASVSASQNTASGAATYTITFSTSASGSLTETGATITLTAPQGTALPSTASAYSLQTVSGHTANVAAVTRNSWPAGVTPANQALLSLTGSTIAGGDVVTLTITGAGNPPVAGDYSMILSSSADPQPIQSAPYAIAGAGTASSAPAASQVSLVALTGVGPAGTPQPGPPMRGLLFDEWPEQIPNSIESSSLVFHYEEPTARAPQSLLLALNPTSGPWTYGLLSAILTETLDLAKVRTVDLFTLSDGEQLIPAMYIPYNLDGSTITTTLGCFHPSPPPTK